LGFGGWENPEDRVCRWLTRRPLFFLLRFEGDDHIFRSLVAQGLYGVLLLKFAGSGLESHLLGAFLFSVSDGDGFRVNPFEFCERLTDVRLTSSSGDSCHAHLVGGRRLLVTGKAESDKQQRKHRCQQVNHSHVFVLACCCKCFRTTRQAESKRFPAVRQLTFRMRRLHPEPALRASRSTDADIIEPPASGAERIENRADGARVRNGSGDRSPK
jgi:hypothetical protein